MKRLSTALCLMILMCAIGYSPLVYGSTNPVQDTDGDGIPDIEEDINQNNIQDAGETDQFNTDSDRGGESDGSEKSAKRNPLDQTDDLTFDADADGWVNGIELLRGTDPKKTDSDNDGTIDSKDSFPLDSKYSKDENGNGLPDEWEAETKLNKEVTPQSRADDPDSDGLTNAEELSKGTDPLSADSDKDGTNDFHEIFEGTDPKENACLEYQETEKFPDTSGHWAEADIQLARGIIIKQGGLPLIQGRKSKKAVLFEPNSPITRYEFLKIVLFSSCTKLLSNESMSGVIIKDVPLATEKEPLDTRIKQYVLFTAKKMGIIEGYSDGTMRPDQNITRAEAVKILLKVQDIDETNESGSGSNFLDVPENAWFTNIIHAAKEREIITGYTDGTFRPEAPISRAEGITIVLRVLRQNPSINGYIVPESME